MANARHDGFIKEIRHEFGAQGVEAWWNLVEFISESVKPSSPQPRVLATPKVFSEECYCPIDTLQNLIRFAARLPPRGKLKFRKRATRWSVEIPKVLEFRDEHSRRQGIGLPSGSGETQEPLPPKKEKKKESQKEKEKKNETRGVDESKKLETRKEPKGAASSGGATLIQKAKAIVMMFQDEPTRIKILEWVGYLENEETVPDRRILDSMKQLWNMREGMIGDNGLPAGRIFRYAVEQSMKHKAKNADYTAKVIQNTIMKWRDGAF